MAKKAKEVIQQPVENQLAHYDRILELGAYVDDRQKELDAQKEAMKDAKEQWEQAVFALQQAIRRANDPQGELDFGGEDE
jgi:hypothetical protein